MQGKTLSDRYKIVKHLGEGGFGQTYLAEDLQLPGNPLCVVKQLKPKSTDALTLQVAKRLFDREAQVLYELGNHEQIPRLLAHFEQEQEFYLVQEFIEGHDLKQELPLGKPFSEIQVIALCQEILKILEFVHQQGVIHRDIKPSNLIRRKRDGKIVLIDFGAVKQVTTQRVNRDGETTLTVAIGSPGYMPNEQLSGRPQFCSDIYAVGMLGIQALTGLPPNQLPEDSKTSEILWRDRLLDNTLHQSIQVNSELADVLDKMVRYDYRQRYQTAIEAWQALQCINLNFSTQAYAPPTATVTSPSDQPQAIAIPTLPTQTSHPKEETRSGSVTPFNASTQPLVPPSLPSQTELLSGSVIKSPESQPAPQLHPQRVPRQLIGIGAGIATVLALTLGVYYVQKPRSLWEKAQNITLDKTLPGHASGINSIALSPDGQLLASGSLDKTIKIRNLRTTQVIRTLTGHTDNVVAIAFGIASLNAVSPDGQILVSGSSDKAINVWNLSTGQLLRTLKGHADYVSSLAISPDGQTLISGSNDKTIKLWNLRTGEVLRTLEPQGYSNGVAAVAISPDGQTLISSDSSDIKLWNLSTGKFLRTLEGHQFPVRAFFMSASGDTLASGSEDGTAKLWNLRTGELLNNFPHGSVLPDGQPSEGVYAVALSPDGQTLVTGSGLEENTIKVWNVRTGELVGTLKGHSKPVLSLVISPDGRTIYSGSLDGTIKVWRSP